MTKLIRRRLCTQFHSIISIKFTQSAECNFASALPERQARLAGKRTSPTVLEHTFLHSLVNHTSIDQSQTNNQEKGVAHNQSDNNSDNIWVGYWPWYQTMATSRYKQPSFMCEFTGYVDPVIWQIYIYIYNDKAIYFCVSLQSTLAPIIYYVIRKQCNLLHKNRYTTPLLLFYLLVKPWVYTLKIMGSDPYYHSYHNHTMDNDRWTLKDDVHRDDGWPKYRINQIVQNSKKCITQSTTELQVHRINTVWPSVTPSNIRSSHTTPERHKRIYRFSTETTSPPKADNFCMNLKAGSFHNLKNIILCKLRYLQH